MRQRPSSFDRTAPNDHKHQQDTNVHFSTRIDAKSSKENSADLSRERERSKELSSPHNFRGTTLCRTFLSVFVDRTTNQTNNKMNRIKLSIMLLALAGHEQATAQDIRQRMRRQNVGIDCCFELHERVEYFSQYPYLTSTSGSRIHHRYCRRICTRARPRRKQHGKGSELPLSFKVFFSQRSN